MRDQPALLDSVVSELFDRIAEGAGVPAGAVAALIVAAAAGLVTMVARASKDQWPEAGGVAAQSEAIRARVAPMAQQNADTYSLAVEQLRAPADAAQPRDLAATLRAAADLPARIGQAAADVAMLAQAAATSGAAALRPDARVAAQLAAGAARSAELLVAVNLTVSDDDADLEAARVAAAAARRAADAAARDL